VGKPIGTVRKRRSRTLKEIFGRALTELRTAKMVSQVDLAAELGYSTNYVILAERGKANFSCDFMEAVLQYFKMSVGQFWIYAEKLAKTKA
jgi:transcriptional regulator with XRE-family HTH domain